MPIYSWPANLAKNNDVWITSLVDWPSIAAIGDVAEESVLAACSELSAAIQARISKCPSRKKLIRLNRL